MRQLPFDLQKLVSAFARYDADVNGGRGWSDSPDSGRLGWGESGFLESYVKLYETTGDAGWLDRIVDHFDRIADHATDSFGDGLPTWTTATYSVARIRGEPLHNRGTGELSLLEGQVWTTRGGDQVQDRELVLEFVTRSRYRIFEMPSRRLVSEGDCRRNREIAAVRPFRVAISGRPAAGDRFRIQSLAPRPQDYVVHQGMFLYPVARFIELVSKSRSLKDRHGQKARSYLELIARLALGHERDWLNTGRAAGAYRFPPEATGRYPNRILPHNQYLAMARAYLVLKDACRRKLFPDRAERMARHFRSRLRRTGRAYTWHYWDWVEGGMETHGAVEDTSHGHIDIGFAVEACRRGLVFRDADLRRFAATLTDQMWNGSLDNPAIGRRLDTREGDARVFRDWIDLCQWDARIWEIYWALFCRLGQPVQEIPTILRGWQRRQEGRKRGRRG